MSLLDLKFLIAGIVIGTIAILLAFYSTITKLSLAELRETTLNIQPYSCQSINIKWFGPIRINVSSTSILKVKIHDILGKLIYVTYCNNTCNIYMRELSYIDLCAVSPHNVTAHVTVYKYKLVMPHAKLAIAALVLGFLSVTLILLSLRGLRRSI